MSVLGIDEITYGVDDLATCRRFFLDWGLRLVDEAADRLVFECLNGCRVIVAANGHADLPPYAFGYVYLPAMLGVGVASIPCARLGAKLAHHWPAATLKRVFAGFMIFIGGVLLAGIG